MPIDIHLFLMKRKNKKDVKRAWLIDRRPAGARKALYRIMFRSEKASHTNSTLLGRTIISKSLLIVSRPYRCSFQRLRIFSSFLTELLSFRLYSLDKKFRR